MVGVAVAAAVAAVVGGVALSVGRRWQLYDLPDDHLKTHTGAPVPLGGVAVFSAIHLGLAAAERFDLALFAATMLVLVVGMVDDRRPLSPLFRLPVTFVAGVMLVTWGFPELGWWGGVAGVVLTVASVNAVNLLDGLDAMVGSVVSVVFAGLALLALVTGALAWWVPLIPAAAALGFLGWNLPPARLYLGDGGAYVLGVSVAWAILEMRQGWALGLSATILVGVPFLDLGATVLRRRRTGVAIFGGDRRHSYDRLHDRGWSAGAVSATFASVQVVWVLAVVLLVWLLDPWRAVGIGVAAAIGATVLLTVRSR